MIHVIARVNFTFTIYHNVCVTRSQSRLQDDRKITETTAEQLQKKLVRLSASLKQDFGGLKVGFSHFRYRRPYVFIHNMKIMWDGLTLICVRFFLLFWLPEVHLYPNYLL